MFFIHDVKRYQRIKLIFSILGTLVFLIYTIIWGVFENGYVVGLSNNRWFGLLMFGVVFALLHEVITLPLGYYEEYVIEHRYEQSNQFFSRWFSQLLKGWFVGGILGGIILVGIYSCLWYGGYYWWLWIGIGWIGLTVILAQLFPVLLLPIFYKSEILDNEELANSLSDLANNTSIKIDGIYRLDLSEDTKAANAMLTGLGSTRRVYISDTLLDNFSTDEIQVVFAHELGHHTRGHMWKILFMSVFFSAIHIAILAYFLNSYRGSDADNWRLAISMLPWCLFAITMASVVVKPIHNAISRHFERQCDGDALRSTRDAKAYKSAFRRLSEMNLSDPDPHPVVEWLFYDHPSISRRLAMADEYEEKAIG